MVPCSCKPGLQQLEKVLEVSDNWGGEEKLPQGILGFGAATEGNAGEYPEWVPLGHCQDLKGENCAC